MPEQRYEVVLNTRERFTVIVLASSKREAASKARSGVGPFEDSWASMEREITGVVSVEAVVTKP